MATVFSNTGKVDIVDKLDIATGSAADFKYVAWGTGAGTAAATDTTLFTEASEARVTGTVSQQTTSVTGDTYQVVGTITADGTKTITNAGLFDASSAGDLLIKGDFTGVALVLNDQIEFTFKLVVA